MRNTTKAGPAAPAGSRIAERVSFVSDWPAPSTDSAEPSARRTPSEAQCASGLRLRRSALAASKPFGTRTSKPQDSPPRQPARLRKLAVDASASGMLPTTSRRPSPSKSTARRMNDDGMNCVCPKAPAQDPTRRSGSMWPSCRMRSAVKNSPRKNDCLRPSHDSVASEITSGREPKDLP